MIIKTGEGMTGEAEGGVGYINKCRVRAPRFAVHTRHKGGACGRCVTEAVHGRGGGVEHDRWGLGLGRDLAKAPLRRTVQSNSGNRLGPHLRVWRRGGGGDSDSESCLRRRQTHPSHECRRMYRRSLRPQGRSVMNASILFGLVFCRLRIRSVTSCFLAFICLSFSASQRRSKACRERQQQVIRRLAESGRITLQRHPTVDKRHEAHEQLELLLNMSDPLNL